MSGLAARASGRMPGEWEPHEATWIAWPHHEPDWPGKLETIQWVYAEIVRALHDFERVEILCHDEHVRESARRHLEAHGVRHNFRLHSVPNDRVWLRDSAPTGIVRDDGSVALVGWRFNGWAKYSDYALDGAVGASVAQIAGLPLIEPLRPDNGDRVVLEGGAIDTDGEGTVLVTEECLLSPIQQRNPGLDRGAYERVFHDYLGARQTLWLGDGCAGDDTHGHIDDVARFIGPGVIALAYEEDPTDENHLASVDNLARLQAAGADAGALRVVKLPFPRAVVMDGQRLPASYANFYVANGVVLVPTFNDPADRVALNILAELFPDRRVVGIHSVDLVWGLGTVHCLTQQQPRGDSNER
jgi:agmatine deiminase